jgi:hypothetical protein
MLSFSMTIFVEFDERFGEYEITQAGGMGILTTAKTRDAAISEARVFADRGQDIAIMGPRMDRFKKLTTSSTPRGQS